MSKIIFLNGSPRFKNSTSAYLLGIVSNLLTPEDSITQYHIASLNTDIKKMEAFTQLSQADTILLAFPLYIDSLPSHLIGFLQEWETYLKAHPPRHAPKLFALSNNGFIEGEQNRIALDMVRHFSLHAGLPWCLGVGIGGGEFMKSSDTMPLECKIKSAIYQSLCLLAKELSSPTLVDAPHQLSSPQMSKRVFAIMADMFWFPECIKKGGRLTQLWAKPLRK